MCYEPDVKPGPCKAPYIVVYDGGCAPQPGTRGRLGSRALNLMALVPIGQEAALKTTLDSAARALSAVHGIHPSGEITPVDTDQERAALCQTTTYIMPVRL